MKINIFIFLIVCFFIANQATSHEYQDYQIEDNYCIYEENYDYLKLGAGWVDDGIGPSIGIGRRFAIPGSAVDISFNFMGNDKCMYYSVPKMSYLRYLTPYSPSSFYLGGGLGIGKIKSKQYKFSGLLADVIAGIEMHRFTKVKFFAEINLNHGIISFKSKHKLRRFSPAIGFAMGAGF